jgi:hypothetical protein
MDKRQYEFIAIGFLALSLLYVPTKLCNGGDCVTADWSLIFNLNFYQTVDFSRLLIQVAIVAIALYGYWRYRYRD